MSKKPSKSKAKRRPARKPARRPGGKQLVFDFNAVPKKRRRSVPDRPPSQAVIEARQRAEASRAALREKRDQHDAMQRRYQLPRELQSFLDRLYVEPDLWRYQRDGSPIPREEVAELLQQAYVQGCTQGYIEGRVVDLEPKRERSRKANAARREKHNLDQRDAEIVEKFRRLRAEAISAGDAQARLAIQHGLTDKMIRIIIGKANKAAR